MVRQPCRGRKTTRISDAIEGQNRNSTNRMIFPPAPDRLDRAYQAALAALLAERTPEGHWVGELSTSALSTATAVSALSLVQQRSKGPGAYDRLIAGGLDWLAGHQNADGGWGDTVKSISNISTS